MTLKILIALFGLPLFTVGLGLAATAAEVAPPVASIGEPQGIAQADTNAQNQGKTPLSPPLPVPATPTPAIILPPESSRPSPTLESPTPESPTLESPTPESTTNAVVKITRIDVVGSTVLSAATIAAIVQPFEGQSLRFDQLQAIADRLTQAYLQRGYLTSRARWPEQTIKSGVVQIQIQEGSLADVEVIGTKRLSANYIRQQIAPGIRSPLSQPKLEDQLRLLKLDPLLNQVEASIRQATQPGQSVLTVRVAEAPAVFGSVSLDNDSVPSVGGADWGDTRLSQLHRPWRCAVWRVLSIAQWRRESRRFWLSTAAESGAGQLATARRPKP